MATSSFASAETTLYQAQNGPASATSTKRRVSRSRTSSTRPTRSASTRQRHALTFLDPRCWTDCPLLAQQLKVFARTCRRARNSTSWRGGRSLPRAAQRSTPFHRYSRTHAVKNFTSSPASSHRQKSLGVVRNRRVHDQVGRDEHHSDYMFIINAKYLVKGLSPTIRFPVRRVRPPRVRIARLTRRRSVR